MNRSVFLRSLLSWYYKNKRKFPWREKPDPYFVWISEIIFQQTRIGQGMSFYENFIHKFPNVQSLAEAKEEEVLKLWQGLGYYSRARNLYAAAQQIVKEHSGKIPQNAKDLLKLKGIGEYTMSAIMSICFKKPYAVVDGNVKRVISRFFLIGKQKNETTFHRIILRKVSDIIPDEQPGDFNQAMMELGALICLPAKPKCNICPLNELCEAKKKNCVQNFPPKKNKVKLKDRYFNYFLLYTYINNQAHFYIQKRKKIDIWQNLYELPVLEEPKFSPHQEVVKAFISKFMNKEKIKDICFANENIRQRLTHQMINARFYKIHISEALHSDELLLTDRKSLDVYPFPKIINNFLINNAF